MNNPIPPSENSIASTTSNWSEVMVVHEGWLRKVILARTGEPQAVDDVFQQLALVACAGQASIRDRTRIAPWLHRIAVVLSSRHCRSMGRLRNKHQRLQNLASNETPVVTGLELLVHRERQAIAQRAILRLEPRDREILTLKYEERHSYREIAERLGISEKAIDRRLSRARDRLRGELKKLGMGEIE